MKKNVFIHPLIFAIFPTLILYIHNVRESWPSLMITPMAYSLLLGGVSWLLFLAIFRSKVKASIMTSVWLIAFFSYGHAFLFAANHGLFQLLPLGPHLVMLGSYFMVLVCAFSVLLFTHKKLDVATAFFNVASLTLFAINVIPLIPFEINRLISLHKLTSYVADLHIRDAAVQNTDSSSYPDIYYIIFDRYANNSILPKYFEYDNEPFLTTLRDKNFYVAEESFANYPTTFLSLSSSLNMTHLNFLKDVLGENYVDQSILYKELLEDSEAVQFLDRRGYQYYQLGSSWEPTKKNRRATENYNLFISFNEFNSFLFENTLLNAILGKLPTGSQQVFTGVKLLEIKAENSAYKVEKIEELSNIDAPKFVFAHFLLPHPPYLLADDCHTLTLDEVRHRTANIGYMDQLKCANKLMTELSDKLLENNKRPLVLIFQSDEGPYLPTQYFNDSEYLPTPEHDAEQIHSRILNALYVSDKNVASQSANYEDIGLTQAATPVNTFRLLFNYFFGTTYERQEDRSFIGRDSKKPYVFSEITDFAKQTSK